MKFSHRIIIAVVLIPILLTAILYVKIDSPVGDGNKSVDFIIPAGAGPVKIAKDLEKQGLIRSALLFRLKLFLLGKQNEIKKGVFTLYDIMSTGDIIKRITDGKIKMLRVTVPEGYNNRQIADLLISKGFIKSRSEFDKANQDETLLAKFKIPVKTFEGYLFPETYHFPVDYPIQKIVETMVGYFFQHIGEIKDFPKDSKRIHQIVTLASIVEKEAKVKEERTTIAGVFQNRLNAHYPLESCATVQYLFEKPKKRLLFKHLRIESPYNTYQIKGLPPHPIASPGLASIKAAFQPAKTPYKFFVVKGDGKHQFSEFLGDHEKAKKKYIQLLR